MLLYCNIMNKPILITINANLLYSLDSYVLKLKRDNPRRHYSRRIIIENALDYYFKINLGIPYIVKKNG